MGGRRAAGGQPLRAFRDRSRGSSSTWADWSRMNPQFAQVSGTASVRRSSVPLPTAWSSVTRSSQPCQSSWPQKGQDMRASRLRKKSKMGGLVVTRSATVAQRVVRYGPSDPDPAAQAPHRRWSVDTPSARVAAGLHHDSVAATTVRCPGGSFLKHPHGGLARERRAFVGSGWVCWREPAVTAHRAPEPRCLHDGCATVARRGVYSDRRHEAAGPPTEDRRSGSEYSERAVRALLQLILPSDTTPRYGPMFSECVIPGCGKITMGGTCVEHDSPVSVTFPRGRPHPSSR